MKSLFFSGDAMKEKNCSTCKWWERGNYMYDEDEGECEAPLPAAIVYPNSIAMREKDGAGCKCHCPHDTHEQGEPE